jgi:putative membrane protein
MSEMSGAQFHRDFATHMVADHQWDIAEYEAKHLNAAGDYAKGQVDVVQEATDTAKSLRTSKMSSR